MDASPDHSPRPTTLALPDRGGTMSALEFGPAERPIDIVFSHATGFNARAYRTILEPLAADLRILALDLRGHGGSTLPADPHSFPGWSLIAQDLVAVLELVVERPVVLAGHSMGATTSLLAAVEAPERVRSLALFEPVMTDRPPQFGEHPFTEAVRRRREQFPSRAAALAAYLGRGAFRTWSEAQVADYVAGGFRDLPSGEVALACRPLWEAAIYAEQRYDAVGALGEVRRPVHVLAGQEGSTMEARARACMAKVGRLDVIEGATHFLPMERPELVRQALRDAVLG